VGRKAEGSDGVVRGGHSMSVCRDNSLLTPYVVVMKSGSREDEGASFMGRRQATAIPAVWIVGLGWRAI
jgi:hypothetical protein